MNRLQPKNNSSNYCSFSSSSHDINPIGPQAKERVGYPTQKPSKLIERIINCCTKAGDVVADFFFCGGGTTPCVAQKLNRRWIACDQSKVAVAITQGRLETMYEEDIKQASLSSVPDFYIEYWGTYEVPALAALSDQEFRSFIISAYGGRVSSVGDYIHGFKREIPLFVGPSSQEKQVTKDDVINFANEITTKKGRRRGTMLSWAFSPSARIAVEKLMAQGNPEVDMIQISAIEIESPNFREHVTKLHNEYESLLTFILPPEVRLSINRIESLTYQFDVSESVALNNGSKIINVQWDFNFKGRFTPTNGYAFGRDNQGNPLYKVEYIFERIGNTTIACRVQDDLGGEKIYSHILKVI